MTQVSKHFKAHVTLRTALADEYLNEEDGLLYCRNCHTRRQVRIQAFGRELTPSVLCKCQAEQQAKEDELRKQPLIVTTNLTLDELKHPADLVHARIYDRVLERCVPLKINNRNIRAMNAAERIAHARDVLCCRYSDKNATSKAADSISDEH